jgi:hypothetical protein
MTERRPSGWSPSGMDYSWIRPQRVGDDEVLRVIGMPLCWCGDEKNHDWPGRADGAPHPRKDRTVDGNS